jgi:hypothetical protein
VPDLYDAAERHDVSEFCVTLRLKFGCGTTLLGGRLVELTFVMAPFHTAGSETIIEQSLLFEWQLWWRIRGTM